MGSGASKNRTESPPTKQPPTTRIETQVTSLGSSAPTTPGGAAGPAHAAHDVEICGVPTKVALTAYSNRVFVVVTQTDNLGTLIAAERDLAIDPTCTCYSTRVLLGRRDDETLEVYARTMVELVAKRAPAAPPLLLAISIREHSPEAFRAVMQFVDEHRVWG